MNIFNILVETFHFWGQFVKQFALYHWTVVCLSVTLVYCGQTVGPSSPESTAAPTFWTMSIVAKWLDGSRCHLVQR